MPPKNKKKIKLDSKQQTLFGLLGQDKHARPDVADHDATDQTSESEMTTDVSKSNTLSDNETTARPSVKVPDETAHNFAVIYKSVLMPWRKVTSSYITQLQETLIAVYANEVEQSWMVRRCDWLLGLHAPPFPGAAESGKSTLVKQMKIIHNEGFTFDELIAFKPAVLDNLVSSMKYVLTGMGLLRINLENPKNRYNAQVIISCNSSFDQNKNMLVDVTKALKSLWHDKGVRTAVARGYEYELNDSAIYYFENMERICSPKFIPTQRDVLRARVRTQGVIETCFRHKGVIIRMFDVGGQRSERRKWIQCFDDVRSVLYVMALSAYDMCLLEDSNVNRLQESLKLFRGICNNRFFMKSCMILFLNKVDLFRDKVRFSGRHLRYFFPDFQGADKDVDSAARFIQHMFQEQNLTPGKVIYPHFTTATDTSNMQVVFQVVMDSVLRENLKSTSIL